MNSDEVATATRERFDIPASWDWADLSHLTPPEYAIIYGILQPGPEQVDGIIYVRPTEIDEDYIDIENLRKTTPAIAKKYARATLAAGDVLLSIVGTVGKVAIVPPALTGANITQSSVRVRPASLVTTPTYLAWALRSPQARSQYDGLMVGTAVRRLNVEDVRRISLPIAPLAEQRRISAELDRTLSIAKASEVNLKRNRAKLAAYRAAVLRAACEGRLVPTEAELARAEGREYESAGARIAKTPIAPRPNRYESRSREIIPGHSALAVCHPGTEPPEGWAWAPLVEIAKMESGHTPSRSRPEWWGGDIPWITLPDARDYYGKTILETAENTNPDGLANSAARLLPAGTVCLSRTASVGYVTVMGRPMATSQDFVNWTPTAAVTSDWLRIVFLADREALRRFGKGSVHKTIYFPECLSLHAAIPPLAEQGRIVAEVERRLSVVERLEAAIDVNLARGKRLRQAILKRAFEGRLVPQDPNDEPASVLLERIRKERESAGAKGKTARGAKKGAAGVRRAKGAATRSPRKGGRG